MRAALLSTAKAIRSEGWVPGAFPLRGSAKYAGSVACSCMKHCQCDEDECVCKDAKQLPVGPGSFTPTVKLFGEKSDEEDRSSSRRSSRSGRSSSRRDRMRNENPEGRCSCTCNQVPGETPAEIKSRWFLEVAFDQIMHPRSQSAGRRLLSESLARSRPLRRPNLRLKADPATGWCEVGFHQLQGDVPGFGKIGTMGGGQDVQDCSECAVLCQSIDACLSYQCSLEELKCKLNVVSEPTPGAAQYRDWIFCKKDGASSAVATSIIPSDAPPPSSDPPPGDAKLCSLKRSGYCKSYLNSRCSDWRDSAHLWRQSKQIEKMEDCMKQDCEQSLRNGGETEPGCRFVDVQGFCYKRYQAQLWCAKDGLHSTFCTDLGEEAASPPLGKKREEAAAGRRLLESAQGVSTAGRASDPEQKLQLGGCDCSKCPASPADETVRSAPPMVMAPNSASGPSALARTEKREGDTWAQRLSWLRNFQLPALIYPENHWLKRGKWHNDMHDGEKKAGIFYPERKRPATIKNDLSW